MTGACRKHWSMLCSLNCRDSSRMDDDDDDDAAAVPLPGACCWWWSRWRLGELERVDVGDTAVELTVEVVVVVEDPSATTAVAACLNEKFPNMTTFFFG